MTPGTRSKPLEDLNFRKAKNEGNGNEKVFFDLYVVHLTGLDWLSVDQ